MFHLLACHIILQRLFDFDLTLIQQVASVSISNFRYSYYEFL